MTANECWIFLKRYWEFKVGHLQRNFHEKQCHEKQTMVPHLRDFLIGKLCSCIQKTVSLQDLKTCFSLAYMVPSHNLQASLFIQGDHHHHHTPRRFFTFLGKEAQNPFAIPMSQQFSLTSPAGAIVGVDRLKKPPGWEKNNGNISEYINIVVKMARC